MAIRTIKVIDAPGGRFTLEEAREAARALKKPSPKPAIAAKSVKKKAPAKKVQ